MRGAKGSLKAISHYLPEEKLTNQQLAEEFGDWDASNILATTGIATRSVARSDECASDLGVVAANRLFESGVCATADIDFLIFCSQSPDYFMPTTACLIQKRLTLNDSCGALDVNLGCSGFVYGLALANSLIETGTATNVLLITAETYSKFINPRDRSVRAIFSDAAAATLVSSVQSELDLIGPFVFGTDGGGAENVIIPAGGLRYPVTPEAKIEKQDRSGNWRCDRDLYMNGAEVFNFALQRVPRAIEQLLGKWGRGADEVDYFIFHQANKFILDRLRNKLKIPAEKFWIDLESVGNTASSTIPIALKTAMEAGEIRPGHHVALIGFGVGYSWAAAMVQIV